MWYHKTADGTLTQVKCEVQPNSDISGIGVRDAFYLQAAIATLLTLFESTPTQVFLSNISLLGTSFAIIFSAYFDPTIDIPHAIIASQLAYMLSWGRYRFSSFGGLPRRIKNIRMRWALWLFERAVNWVLISFNYRLWSFIRTLQEPDETECTNGFGYWALLPAVALKERSWPSTFAYVWCILDIVSEGSLLFLTMARIYFDRLRSGEMYLYSFLWVNYKTIVLG